MRLLQAIPLLASAWIGACAGEVAPAAEVARADITAFGRDEGQGNLLGVQPWLTPLDYATPERLDRKLRAWLDEAAQQGLINDRTVVVFPEYMGTWLVAVDEGPDVVEGETIADALGALAGAHLVDFLGAMASSPAEDAAAHAAFTTKAERMAAVHQQVLGGIARDYGVVVTGGSVLLPRPAVDGGIIVVEKGAPLQNVVFTFHPDGSVDPQVVRKAFPIEGEQAFIEGADVEDIPVFDTPAGTLGVLVCADSWYPAAWRVLEEKGAEMAAVPVFVEGKGEDGDGAWDDTWRGYSGADEPGDVNVDDIGAILESDAWRKYSLPGRAPRANIQHGLTVPLRGALWDLVDDGQGLVVNGEARERARDIDGPQLISLWL